MSVHKGQLFCIGYKDEGKRIKQKHNLKWEFQGFPHQKRFRGVFWICWTLKSIWTFVNSVFVLTGCLETGSCCSKGGQRDQAHDGKCVPLTLLSSPYLIISWAKSSVGLTRTNAWTFFLVPIPAKNEKTVQLSVVVIEWPSWGGGCCGLQRRVEHSDMQSVFSYPQEPVFLLTP